MPCFHVAVGGLAHIKRSATDSSEEPAQKRLTPETKPKHPKSTRPPKNEPTLHAAPTSRVALAVSGNCSCAGNLGMRRYLTLTCPMSELCLGDCTH